MAKIRKVIVGFGLTESEVCGSVDASLACGDGNNPPALQVRYLVTHDKN